MDFMLRTLMGRSKKTQADMDVLYQGAQWNLAERYTDMASARGVALLFGAQGAESSAHSSRSVARDVRGKWELWARALVRADDTERVASVSWRDSDVAVVR